MTKTEMKKWVEALRRGNYKQGRDSLVSVDEEGRKSFCCLGVAVAEGLCSNSGNTFVSETFLPQHVQDNLAGMNDGVVNYDRVHSFIEIADYIEKHYTDKEWQC